MTMLEKTRGEWQSPSSFKREPLPLPPGNVFVRLVAAYVISHLTRTPVAHVIEDRWPSDRLVARAASVPAMTSVTGWAAEIATKIVTDALDALSPVSAAAQLMKRGLVLNFDRHETISVPGFVASSAFASFIQEGAPIPVRQLATISAQLSPYKLAAIAILTREMVESSNAERMIGDVLMRSEGLALDAAFFDSNAATAARPAGIRNGIAALTASVNTDTFGSFFEDLSTLVSAVAPIGGRIVLIANAGRCVSMESRPLGGELPLGGARLVIEMFATAAAGNDLIAVAPAGLVSAFSPDPEIETSNAATLQLSDSPQQIVNGGAMASPVKSLLQVDSVAVKVRWPLAWAVRSPLAVSWLTPLWK